MLNLKMRLATKLESSALPDKLQLTFDEPNTVSGHADRGDCAV